MRRPVPYSLSWPRRQNCSHKVHPVHHQPQEREEKASAPPPAGPSLESPSREAAAAMTAPVPAPSGQPSLWVEGIPLMSAKCWQSWRGLILLCVFSAFPGNGARKELDCY